MCPDLSLLLSCLKDIHLCDKQAIYRKSDQTTVDQVKPYQTTSACPKCSSVSQLLQVTNVDLLQCGKLLEGPHSSQALPLCVRAAHELLKGLQSVHGVLQ